MIRPCARCQTIFEHRGPAKYCSPKCKPYQPKTLARVKPGPKRNKLMVDQSNFEGIYQRRWNLLWSKYSGPKLREIMMDIEREISV